MGKRLYWWAIAACLGVVIAAGTLGYFSNLVADEVQRSIDHPHTDSFGGLMMMVGIMLFAWTPLLALGLWSAWSIRFRRQLGHNNESLQAAARRAGARVPAWLWTLWRVLCWLVPLVLLVTLWQGFAEHSRIAPWPVLWIQLIILGAWAVASLVIVDLCGRAADSSAQ